MGKYNFVVREVSNMEKNYKEILIKEIESIEDEKMLRFLYIFVKDLNKSDVECTVSDLS